MRSSPIPHHDPGESGLLCWRALGGKAPDHGGEYLPFRAVVKDYISGTTPFKTNMIQKMKNDILELNNIGVYVMDIRPPNYKHGLLLDF